MRIPVYLCAILSLSAFAVQLAPAFAQEDPKRYVDEQRRAEEERRMSDAKRASDREVDHKAYASQDVSREQLSRLTANPTPSTPKPPSGSSGAAAARGH